MPGYRDYERLERRSLEDSGSLNTLETIDEDEKHLENTQIPEKNIIRRQFNRHQLLASILVFSALIISVALLLIVPRYLAKSKPKETRIMNLQYIGDETQHDFLNPPQPDAVLTSVNTSCGNTPRIARSLGCVFDVMSFAWVPAECVDTEMHQRYIDERNWELYEDYYLTKRLSMDVVLAGEYRWLFSSQTYHIAHCVYTWEKQGKFLFAKSREDEKWIDDGSFSSHHTTHCVDYILKRHVEPNKVSTIWNEAKDCYAVDTIGTL
ncbi:hypothetical protein ONS95_009161 [Cadophora gregata]|uniref:uncharacterized protein n=1 Tax=Cadophora gregata TaxID=51156 RepID=UPI0026DB4FB4|nr:uncharacterized protein ONS95_009161 [Cadophora gregata]KAK0124179.1 hypothetical protein ONS95_009161 [Cadophora gregata]KAK0130511.1 hypothetical protein ONS96_001028 [Cadophora gregata f. sp. sojae]